MKIKKYSYSRLNSYKNCPLKYRLTYIDKIEKYDESIEAFFGKLIHKCLEWVYNEKIKNNKKYFSLDQLTNKYKEYWDQDWHDKIRMFQYRYPKKIYDFVKKKKMDYYTLGINNLVNYYSSHGPYFDNDTVNVEQKIEFSLLDYSFVGVIDRIDQDNPSKIHIIDYKTGKKNLSQKQLSKSLQMGLYSYAVQSKFSGIKAEDIILSHYYTRNGKLVSIDGSDIDYEQLDEKLINSIKLIEKSEQGNNFESKESNLCNWCYFWEECDKKNGKNPSLFLE